jgi:hypothetical protein
MRVIVMPSCIAQFDKGFAISFIREGDGQGLSGGRTRTFDAGLYDLTAGIELIRPPAEVQTGS